MSAEATPMNPPNGGMAGLRPLLLLVGVAAAVAAGVGIALWSQAPTYSVLLADAASADAAAVTTSLDQSGIQYKLENGAVLVPAERRGGSAHEACRPKG